MSGWHRLDWAAVAAAILCSIEAAEACGPGSLSGTECNNRCLGNKTEVQVVFEIDGGANTVVTALTDPNGAAIPGATVTKKEQGKYEIAIPLALTCHQCFHFCVEGQNLSGSGITTSKRVYTPEDPPTVSFSALVGDAPGIAGDYTAWVDVFAMGGGATGWTQFGVFIPPGMFGYFVQFNNLSTSTVPLTTFTLDQSQAAGPPAIVGDLGLPHDGTRACCGEPGYPVIPVATFQTPGPSPGTPLTSMVYDPNSRTILCNFAGAGGIPPGGTSNVLAYLSPSPPSIQASTQLSPQVSAVSALGWPTTGRALGPRARFGDLDGDGDTDLADFATFAGCFTGAGTYAAVGCDLADLDGDGDVDPTDNDRLAAGFTGPLAP